MAVDGTTAAAAQLVLAPRDHALPANDAPAPRTNTLRRSKDRTTRQTTRDQPDDAADGRHRAGNTRAAIPPGLLSRLLVERAGLGRARRNRSLRHSAKIHHDGRPAGVRQGRPHAGQGAAPDRNPARRRAWQKLRRNAMPTRRTTCSFASRISGCAATSSGRRRRRSSCWTRRDLRRSTVLRKPKARSNCSWPTVTLHGAIASPSSPSGAGAPISCCRRPVRSPAPSAASP